MIQDIIMNQSKTLETMPLNDDQVATATSINSLHMSNRGHHKRTNSCVMTMLRDLDGTATNNNISATGTTTMPHTGWTRSHQHQHHQHQHQHKKSKRSFPSFSLLSAMPTIAASLTTHEDDCGAEKVSPLKSPATKPPQTPSPTSTIIPKKKKNRCLDGHMSTAGMMSPPPIARPAAASNDGNRLSLEEESGLLPTSLMMPSLDDLDDFNNPFANREEGPWLPAPRRGDHHRQEEEDNEVASITVTHSQPTSDNSNSASAVSTIGSNAIALPSFPGLEEAPTTTTTTTTTTATTRNRFALKPRTPRTAAAAAAAETGTSH